MSTKKPIYTMSASLFNSLKWYKGRKSPEQKQQALEQLTKNINKVYEDNEHTLRGKAFEETVMNGTDTNFGVDVTKLDQQKWFNKYIEYGDFIIKLVGKMDLYDEANKQIYDIKRTLNYYDGKYSDKNTIQHDLYLYANPEIERFWYLVAHGEDGNLAYGAFPVERKENLDAYIKNHIEELIIELNNLELLETYFKTHKVNW